MTVYEFCELCATMFIKIKIWSCEKKEYVFEDFIENMKQSEYSSYEINYFEVDDELILNIE